MLLLLHSTIFTAKITSNVQQTNYTNMFYIISNIRNVQNEIYYVLPFPSDIKKTAAIYIFPKIAEMLNWFPCKIYENCTLNRMCLPKRPVVGIVHVEAMSWSTVVAGERNNSVVEHSASIHHLRKISHSIVQSRHHR